MTTVEATRPETPASANRRDHAIWWLAGSALLVSIVAFLWYFSQGTILLYWDAISHLSIARRFFLSPTTGFGQLGYVWLPLPHLLAAPFATVDALYFTGIAGSIVSMAAYVTTAVLLYKVVFHLVAPTHPGVAHLAGIVAAVVFVANPNALYMQSTPMTETLLFACMVGMVFGVQRWIQTDRYGYLIGGTVAGLLGSHTRYEAWILVAALSVVVVAYAWRTRHGKKEGYTFAMWLVWVLTSWPLGWIGWVIWNWLIFGEPLGFLFGEYADSSLWVSATDPAIGNPWVAFKTYYYAMTENLTLTIVVLAALGLVLLLLRERLAFHVWPALSMLGLFPFFWFALMSGQRPLYVLEVNGSLYNVRFGLLMLLPAAILTGYLAGFLLSFLRERMLTGGVLLACLLPVTLAVSTYMTPNGVVTLFEPSGISTIKPVVLSKQASGYLAGNYNGGRILMMSFGNEFVLPQAGIGTDNNVYEGSDVVEGVKGRLWDAALADPAAQNIQWIIMRKPSSTAHVDKVYQALNGSDHLVDYNLEFENEAYDIYSRR
jgi:hypothetical protein